MDARVGRDCSAKKLFSKPASERNPIGRTDVGQLLDLERKRRVLEGLLHLVSPKVAWRGGTRLSDGVSAKAGVREGRTEVTTVASGRAVALGRGDLGERLAEVGRVLEGLFVSLENLDRLFLGAGNLLLAPGAGPPAAAVLDEEVGRADLVAVATAARCTRTSSGVCAVGEVLCAGELGEVLVVQGFGDFPAGLLRDRVVEVGALARVGEADFCERFVVSGALSGACVRCKERSAKATRGSDGKRGNDGAHPRQRPARLGGQRGGSSRGCGAACIPRSTCLWCCAGGRAGAKGPSRRLSLARSLSAAPSSPASAPRSARRLAHRCGRLMASVDAPGPPAPASAPAARKVIPLALVIDPTPAGEPLVATYCAQVIAYALTHTRKRQALTPSGHPQRAPDPAPEQSGPPPLPLVAAFNLHLDIALCPEAKGMRRDPAKMALGILSQIRSGAKGQGRFQLSHLRGPRLGSRRRGGPVGRTPECTLAAWRTEQTVPCTLAHQPDTAPWPHRNSSSSRVSPHRRTPSP